MIGIHTNGIAIPIIDLIEKKNSCLYVVLRMVPIVFKFWMKKQHVNKHKLIPEFEKDLLSITRIINFFQSDERIALSQLRGNEILLVPLPIIFLSKC